LRGYANSHNIALQYWEETYPRELLVALTDTFSTQAFFKVGIHSDLSTIY
jgi:nicotinate phosphoribosyltransferase